jgi:hypothetical protein
MSGTRQKLVMKMPNETPTTLEPQYARYDDIHSQTMIQHLYLYPTVTHRRYRDTRYHRGRNRIEESLDYYARPHFRSERPRGPAADGTGLPHARLALLLPLEKVLVCAEDDARMLMPLQLGVLAVWPANA